MMRLFLVSSALMQGLAQNFWKGDCSEYFGAVDGFVTVVDLDVGLTSTSSPYCLKAGTSAPCTIVHYAGLGTTCLPPGPVDGCHRYVKTTYFSWAEGFLRDLNLSGQVDTNDEFIRSGIYQGAYTQLAGLGAITQQETRCFEPPADSPVPCRCPNTANMTNPLEIL